jgi:hypothetical protein
MYGLKQFALSYKSGYNEKRVTRPLEGRVHVKDTKKEYIWNTCIQDSCLYKKAIKHRTILYETHS